MSPHRPLNNIKRYLSSPTCQSWKLQGLESEGAVGAAEEAVALCRRIGDKTRPPELQPACLYVLVFFCRFRDVEGVCFATKRASLCYALHDSPQRDANKEDSVRW